MSEKGLLGSFEELVLLAIGKLGSGAYGAPIRHAIEEALEKEISAGALYTTLDRLEEKGYVSSWLGEATKERGGKAKRYYRVEGAGEVALRQTNAARARMGEASLAGGIV